MQIYLNQCFARILSYLLSTKPSSEYDPSAAKLIRQSNGTCRTFPERKAAMHPAGGTTGRENSDI